MALVLQNV